VPLFLNRQTLVKAAPGKNTLPSGTVTSSIKETRLHGNGVGEAVNVGVALGVNVALGVGVALGRGVLLGSGVNDGVAELTSVGGLSELDARTVSVAGNHVESHSWVKRVTAV
jgi:hypothetical protein